MRSPAEPVLAVVGDLVEDIVVWTSEPVRHGTDTAARVFRTRGGSAANVAALASGAASARVRFIGCVGPDAAGDALVAALERDGVDVRVQRRGTTGAVVLLVDPEGERTMFPDRGASAELGPIDPSYLDGVSWLHVPLYGFERDPARSSVLGLLALARERGAGVSVDASSTGLLASLGIEEVAAMLRELAPEVLFANETEAEALGLAAGGPAAAAVAATVVVKHGPDPTTVFERGRPTLRVEVEPVDVVRDLTGAGDAFAAGYLAATLAGAAAHEAVLAGHALAARVITTAGATPM
ncbi:carbohydrate kinase family protein [Agromyces larvae]|uniref:PfkB family carbohydrate kinase n=1 Tax=Agromyces larvae TaxID=2929802 RepID=A0ABY4BYY1_9MICO|nr:PfkB family carbohydrate kinase [Agromyces larvae]UOE44427.1 PfkB family carbohydrate kinase [Agromyces larvae]